MAAEEIGSGLIAQIAAAVLLAIRKDGAALDRPEWAGETYVASYTSIPVDTLRYWRKTGQGPAYSKPGPKSVRYRLRDVDAYLESRKTTPA